METKKQKFIRLGLEKGYLLTEKVYDKETISKVLNEVNSRYVRASFKAIGKKLNLDENCVFTILSTNTSKFKIHFESLKVNSLEAEKEKKENRRQRFLRSSHGVKEWELKFI